MPENQGAPLAFQRLCGKLPRVTHLRTKTILRSRYLLAGLAGLIWTAAFPKIGVAGLAWVAPGLLAAAALGKPGGECFRIGLVGSLAHYLSMLYWILLIPYRWHGIPIGPATGWVALSAALSLFTAAWVWLIIPRKAHDSASATAPMIGATQSADDSLRGNIDRVLPKSWQWRSSWVIAAAAAWVGQEMVMTRALGGFPWDLLGVSQYQMVPLIQVAAATGVYGISFLVAWVSLGLLAGGVMLIRRPTARSIWLGELFLPILVVAILFNFGFRHLRSQATPVRSLRVTMVQPSIPQTVIWSSEQDDRRFEDLLRLTRQALSNQTDLLIWPESAVPRMIRYDTNILAAISGLARDHHLWMVLGSDDAEPRRNARNPEEADYFNSSFLINPEGEIMSRYVKRNLVIFGEYVPLPGWLPFLKYFTPVESGFTPGTHAQQFELEDKRVNTSVLICFEDVFPYLGRSCVQTGTDFLVNITNDGWFDESAEQWQHAVSALFRTVENHVPLVRCCNNGLTCWIDEDGRIRQMFRDSRGTIYGEGYLQIELPLRAATEHELTFYTKHGDWFGWGCVALTGVWVVARIYHYWIRNRSIAKTGLA